jgi:hypothetical protein
MTGLDLARWGSLGLLACTWLAAGTLIGVLHFMALQWSLGTLGPRRTRLLLPLTIQFWRFVLLGGVLALIATRFGSPALILTAGGLLAGRTAVLQAVSRR